jgi:hypothetical protein
MRSYFANFLIVSALLTGVASASQGTATMPHAQPPPKPIPANFAQVSPCIPTMGSHYANPKLSLDGNPIYGVYQGKPVFTEIMVTPKDLASGKSWDNIQPLPGYKIDHVDIDYVPNGHPGMPFSHYDIHAYYVPHATHMQFCGGMPALKKMMEHPQ